MKKKAFTLAEVLITLAIIGVVAALVMPGLISDYRKREYVARLQKAVNTWNNSMALMLATDEVDYLNDTEFVQAAVKDYTAAGGTHYPECLQYNYLQGCPNAFNILKKYINFIPVSSKVYSYKYLGFPFGYSLTMNTITANGIFYDFYFEFLGTPPEELLSLRSRNGIVAIDINGSKGPNIIGRDIFNFELDLRGNLLPLYSRQYQEFFGGISAPHWGDPTNSYGCGTPGSSKMSGSFGNGCAARIIENGWVMDY